MRPSRPAGISGSPLPRFAKDPMPSIPAPFSVAFVHFAFPGNPGAIPLRRATGEWVGETPEWTWTGGRRPAALVGGSRPRVRVSFRRTPGAALPDGPWLVECRAHRGVGLRPRRVRLVFGSDGLSQPVDFRLAGHVPAGIGEVRWHWHWAATGRGRSHRLGDTRHHLFHTLRRPVPATRWAATSELAGQGDPRWVYLPVLQWTCQWAAGLRGDKPICDAILAALHRSGLRYGIAAWNVADMLQAGGGYCGGWYRMFQAMAGAQGVTVARRALHVDWRVEHRGIMRWCALVVSAPGLNQRRPVELPSLFHDSNRGPDADDPVQRFLGRRYRFWGHPGQVADGHCVNFLRHGGRWYLYDPSFLDRPVALSRFHLPRPDTTRTVAVEDQGNFQSAYLDRAVGHLLGSLRHVGQLYRTERPDPDHPRFNSLTTRNGLSVKTAIIPPRWRNITFYWTG